MSTDTFIPTRSSLLGRLKDWGDAESWRDFFDTYSKLIYGTAVKAGLSPAEAEDVVQDTVLSVAKAMRDFKYDQDRGSFKGWLLQLTRWRIINQLKKRSPGEQLRSGFSDDTAEVSPAERVADPASLDLAAYWDAEWEKNLMNAAIAKVKELVKPRQYEIFYLHVVKKLSVPAVAASLGVNRAQIYLAKHRVAALIKKEVRRLQQQWG